MAQVTFGNFPCAGPREAAEKCFASHLPSETFLGKANSYTCPLGEMPGHGAVLMRRAYYEDLDPSGTHSLHFSITANEFRGLNESFSVTLLGMIIKDVQSVTPGVQADQNETLVIHFEDLRCLYAMVPVDRAYNVRRQPDGGYFASTLDTGSPWTWPDVCEDLWDAVGKLGAFPGLPFVPSGTPSDLEFWGSSAWKALCDVLSRVGCAARYNPLTGLVEIVRMGQADPAAELALLARSYLKVHDTFPETVNRYHAPASARILFRKLPPPDHKGVSPWHAITVAGSLAGAESGTVQDIHDDMPAVYDIAGALQNGSDLTTRAAERATDYFRMLASGLDSLDMTFAAPLSDSELLPGKEIELVRWQDFQSVGFERDICTFIRRRKKIPEVRFARKDRQETRRVRVVSGDTEANGLMDGFVLTDSVTGIWVDDFACWILETNDTTLEPGNYNAQYLDYHDGRAVYSVTCCGQGGSGSGSGSGQSGGTLPGDLCPEAYTWESQLVCDAEESRLDLYRRKVYFLIQNGCLVRYPGELEFVQTVLCNVDCCIGSGSGSGSSGSSGSSGFPNDWLEGECEQCEPMPPEMLIDVGALTNNSCSSCAGYNEEYLLSYSASCAWIVADQANPCGTLAPETNMTVSLGIDISSTGTLTFEDGVDTFAVYEKENWNCHVQSVFTRVSQSAHCNWPATVTVTPV